MKPVQLDDSRSRPIRVDGEIIGRIWRSERKRNHHYWWGIAPKGMPLGPPIYQTEELAIAELKRVTGHG